VTEIQSPNELFSLNGRCALVTGASSGIGKRMALVLASVGARVAITARRADALAEIEKESEGLAGSIHAFPCDLTNESDRAQLINDVQSILGPIDVLVNNAGAVNAVAIENESLEMFHRMVELNLVAPWHLAKLVGEQMVERRSGSIINIASILGVVGATPAKDSGYSAAKGGLVNLTRELALQWARKGVRVNAICPGWFATEMIDDLLSTENGQNFITTNTPLARVGEVHELDGALLLLACDTGSFITGAIVMVDGGWTAR
jgi:NAD(P)-dependent dehydrogenase (short-subunit alcohol dehydrogenase family)